MCPIPRFTLFALFGRQQRSIHHIKVPYAKTERGVEGETQRAKKKEEAEGDTEAEIQLRLNMLAEC